MASNQSLLQENLLANVSRRESRFDSSVSSVEQTPEDWPEISCSVWAADSCSVIKAFIGTNFFGVAFAFRLCGVGIAIPMFALIAFCVRQGCRMLVKCKVELDNRAAQKALNASFESTNKLGYQPPASSINLLSEDAGSEKKEDEDKPVSAADESVFASVGGGLFGSWMSNVIKGLLTLTQLGYCTGYFVFLSQTLQDLHWLPDSWTRTMIVPLFGVPLFLISLLPNVNGLV